MANGGVDISTIFEGDAQGIPIDSLFQQEEEQGVDASVLFPQQQEPVNTSDLFSSPGTEDLQRQLKPRVDPSSISPWDFSSNAIGNPLKRGFQGAIHNVANLGDAIADFREGLLERVEVLLPEDSMAQNFVQSINTEEVGIGDRLAVDYLRRYAQSIKARPSRLSDTDTWTDWFQPNRMVETILEGAPLTGSLLMTYAINKKAGTAAMVGLEGGSAYATMKAYEEETGEEIPAAHKIVLPLAVGSFNAMLERFGLERILRVAKGAGSSTLRRHLFNISQAGISESITEGGQEFAQAIAEVPYRGIVPNNMGERVIEGMYAGLLMGTTLGTASGLLGAKAHRTPNDSQLEQFTRNEDGELVPTFRVMKPGHELEGQVIGLEEIETAQDLSAPLWRRERLKTELVEALPEEEHMDLKVDRALDLLAARASRMGYENVDSYIAEHGVVAKPGGLIEQGDLLQAEAFHGGPHDFDRFTTEAIGTGEGFQAFGWGLYFTEEKGIAESYARTLSLDINSIENRIRYNGEPIGDHEVFIKKLAPNIDISPTVSIFAPEVVAGLVEVVSLTNVKGQLVRESFEDIKQQIAQEFRDLATTYEQESIAREAYEIAGDIMDTITYQQVSVVAPPNNGIVYKVTLNKGLDTDDYRWLNWRDQLSQEEVGAVQDRLQKHIFDARDRGNIDLVERLVDAQARIQERATRLGQIGGETPTGANIYGDLSTAFESQRIASKFLADLGYAGTKYEANAGRSTSYNFAVFDENIITIEGKEELFQREGQRAKASIRFEDGRTTMRFFQTADISSVLHEMGHLFHNTLSDTELTEATDIWGDLTIRENQESFTRGFEKWLEEGGPANERTSNVFTQFKNWLMEIYSRAAHGLGIELSDQHRQFYENMFDLTIQEIQNAPAPKRSGLLADWFDNFFNWFDVERRFEKVGMGETGFHVKNYFSVQNVYENEGIGTVMSIARSVRADRGKDSSAVLLSEDATAMEEIRGKSETERTDTEQAALVLRDYFDQSQEEYEARGIHISFKERLLADLRQQLLEAENENQQEAVGRLVEEINEVEDIEFTHIPTLYWFRNLIDSSPRKARRLFVDLLATRRQRETLQIKDLIDAGLIAKEDVRSQDIVASYARQKGRDFALMNIRQAASAEGAIVPRALGPRPEGFKDAPQHMRVFKDFYVRDVLYNWVDTQMSTNLDTNLGWARRWINITKMWAFWNPLFLPMYDVLQGHMAGSINILRPLRTQRQFAKAMDDVLNTTEDARMAEENGISSTPFNSPLEQVGGSIDIATRTRFPAHAGSLRKTVGWVAARGEHAIADIISKTTDTPGSFLKQLGGIRPLLRNMYEASWNTAWFLDRVVRQVSYNHFREEGMSPREAAQTAARSHGDYASVPPRTRKTLNTFFFTPTFKIAMGKWMADSIKATGNLLAGTATRNQRQKATVFMRTLAILGGFDMLMLSLGFDRDEWGRRYKRPVDTETGQRELVINWTGPHNLFLKYMQRTREAFGPEVPNSMLRVFQQNSWEVTPLFRIASSVATNTTPGNEKIWFVGDDTMTKVGKATMYFSTSSIAALQQLIGEEQFGQEGAEAFAREYGQLLEQVTSPFLFKYTRQTTPIRFQQKLQMLLRIHEEEVQASDLLREILRRGRNPKEVAEEYIQGKGVFTSTAAERNKNLVRRMQQLIDQWEAENYDMWAPDTLSMDSDPSQGVPLNRLFPEQDKQ